MIQCQQCVSSSPSISLDHLLFFSPFFIFFFFSFPQLFCHETLFFLFIALALSKPPPSSRKFSGKKHKEKTYETFFCVHSRFWRTSCASSMPSAKRARDLASRACAFFCSSKSSRCFAFRWPELCGTRQMSARFGIFLIFSFPFSFFLSSHKHEKASSSFQTRGSLVCPEDLCKIWAGMPAILQKTLLCIEPRLNRAHNCGPQEAAGEREKG